MAEIQSCGFLVFRKTPDLSFLLMKHTDRWDLPKGHVDAGETETECALRELVEETGIQSDDIEIDPAFCFRHEYEVYAKRLKRRATKELVVFLAWLKKPVEIQPTEHPGYQWFPWKPPHDIQELTINPLLAHAARHLASQSESE